jgi:hypothetical protein
LLGRQGRPLELFITVDESFRTNTWSLKTIERLAVLHWHARSNLELDQLAPAARKAMFAWTSATTVAMGNGIVRHDRPLSSLLSNGMGPSANEIRGSGPKRAPRPFLVQSLDELHCSIRTDPRALTAMLEMVPGDVAPEMMFWIHVDGDHRIPIRHYRDLPIDQG